MAADELQCWNAARHLIEHDIRLAQRLIETATSLIGVAEAAWQTVAAQNKLWQLHSTTGEYDISPPLE